MGRRGKRRQVCHGTFWVAAILVTSQSNQAQAFRFSASLLDAQRWEWPFCALHTRMPVTGRHRAHSPWQSCPRSRTAGGCVYQSLRLLSVAESGKSTGTQNKNIYFTLAAVNTEKPACLRLFSSCQKVTRRKPGAEDSSFACLNSLCGLSLPQGCQAAFEMRPDWSPLLQIKLKPRVAPRHEPWKHLLTLFKFEKDSNRRLTRPF